MPSPRTRFDVLLSSNVGLRAPTRRRGPIEVNMSTHQGPAREDRLPPRAHRSHDRQLEHVRDAIKGVHHGEVRVIIQDGLIVQVDRTEKKRVR